MTVDFDENKPHDEIEMTYITTTFTVMNGEATMLGTNEIVAPLRDIPDWEGRPEFDCV